MKLCVCFVVFLNILQRRFLRYLGKTANDATRILIFFLVLNCWNMLHLIKDNLTLTFYDVQMSYF